jgi:flavin-binding protein dodecin
LVEVCLTLNKSAAMKEVNVMSSYKVIEIIGTSHESWESAAKNAIDEAAKSLKHLRVAEVSELDIALDDSGQILEYRAKVKLSLKHEV